MLVMALDLLHCNWMARRQEMVDWASAIIIIILYFTFLLQLAAPVEKLLLSTFMGRGLRIKSRSRDLHVGDHVLRNGTVLFHLFSK